MTQLGNHLFTSRLPLKTGTSPFPISFHSLVSLQWRPFFFLSRDRIFQEASSYSTAESYLHNGYEFLGRNKRRRKQKETTDYWNMTIGSIVAIGIMSSLMASPSYSLSIFVDYRTPGRSMRSLQGGANSVHMDGTIIFGGLFPVHDIGGHLPNWNSSSLATNTDELDRNMYLHKLIS